MATPPVKPTGGVTVRLQRYLASAGVAARRKAEEMITAGRVTVNGKVANVLGTKIDPDHDRVTVDGEAVVALDHFYVLLNKPKACITAVTDDRGRPTVMDYLPNVPIPVKPVGRLDFYTEGVLLLTNDGELAARLLAPASHVPKTYHVKIHGQLDEDQIKQLREGIELDDGGVTMPADVQPLPAESKHTWLAITIHEGKHRQIHRMIEALGFQVDKLQRVAFANLTFHGLRIGDARELTQHELNELRDAVELDHSAVARGRWRAEREETDLQRRARAKVRAEAEELEPTERSSEPDEEAPARGGQGRTLDENADRGGSTFGRRDPQRTPRDDDGDRPRAARNPTDRAPRSNDFRSGSRNPTDRAARGSRNPTDRAPRGSRIPTDRAPRGNDFRSGSRNPTDLAPRGSRNPTDRAPRSGGFGGRSRDPADRAPRGKDFTDGSRNPTDRAPRSGGFGGRPRNPADRAPRGKEFTGGSRNPTDRAPRSGGFGGRSRNPSDRVPRSNDFGERSRNPSDRVPRSDDFGERSRNPTGRPRSNDFERGSRDSTDRPPRAGGFGGRSRNSTDRAPRGKDSGGGSRPSNDRASRGTDFRAGPGNPTERAPRSGSRNPTDRGPRGQEAGRRERAPRGSGPSDKTEEDRKPRGFGARGPKRR